jgi:hypothetical protein
MLKGKNDRIFSFNKSGNYRICVLGSLDESLSAKLNGWHITTGSIKEHEPTTSLVGPIRDQAELSGMLNTLYELHLTLLSVEKLKDEK